MTTPTDSLPVTLPPLGVTEAEKIDAGNRMPNLALAVCKGPHSKTCDQLSAKREVEKCELD